MKRAGILVAVLLLGGCSTGISTQKYNNAPAKPDEFTLCHGYSCTSKSQAGFSATQWKQVASIFKKRPAKNAGEERGKIAKAVALMEKFSGEKTGTSEDVGEAVRLKTSTKQMDCIDETVNTTNYINFLNDEGLLKFHEPALPVHRGYFIDGRWPHNSAVIREKDGPLFVVDSFYRDNGQEPHIVPRNDWINGWRPPGATQ